jgi:hypothetical protein
MTDIIYSGVISALTAKPIIEKLLKPGVKFISELIIK